MNIPQIHAFMSDKSSSSLLLPVHEEITRNQQIEVMVIGPAY